MLTTCCTEHAVGHLLMHIAIMLCCWTLLLIAAATVAPVVLPPPSISLYHDGEFCGTAAPALPTPPDMAASGAPSCPAAMNITIDQRIAGQVGFGRTVPPSVASHDRSFTS